MQVGELAARLERPLPPDEKRAKGFIGDLVERGLGATAGSLCAPDFPALGIELKTIPLDPLGKPRESTFVCTLRFGEAIEIDFAKSALGAKLACVLFVPVETSDVRLAVRRFGRAMLWTPNAHEQTRLDADWGLIATRLAAGEGGHLDAHTGEVLQVRPKGRKAAERRIVTDEHGPHWWQPRGLYLRTSFTYEVLTRLRTHD
jgi:DNA mismatch repair protein MutH